MMKTTFFIFLINFDISTVHTLLVNVAVDKHTTQSGEVWSSTNAVDGNKDCKAVNSTYYTFSENSHLPWWQVDLGDKFRINEIIVYGRNDNIHVTNQLRGFRLYLSYNGTFNKQNIVYTNTDYNNGRIVINKNLTGLFQFVKLDLPDTYRSFKGDSQTEKQKGPLVLCEVEVFVKMANIALGKPATMSSVYSGMIANKSVDNSTSRDANTCNCCSQSSNDTNPWLTVDLLEPFTIFYISVAGRSDDHRDNRMLGGLQIYANGTENIASGKYCSANASGVNVTFPGGLESQYVTLRRPKPSTTNEWYLVVCELNIFVRDCDQGTYGDICEDCGHCSNPPCSKDTGHCPRGVCMAGWTGANCNTTCNPSSYGQNCTETCSTCNRGNCRHTDGFCFSGCVPGYKPDDYCRTPCETGRYGKNCTYICGDNCLHGKTQCDRKNGTCKEGCKQGFMGERCESQCPAGKYDQNCIEYCHHCKSGTICDFRNGSCPEGCYHGFNGSLCDKECHDGYFGDCTHVCHCNNNLPCSKADGYCSNGCALGWDGNNCSIDTDILKRFKDNIRTSMSSVLNNLTSDRAVDGYTGPDPNMCQCCSETQNSQMSWWMVDFTLAFPINGIIVYSRNNEKVLQSLGGFQLNISNLIYNVTAFKSTAKRMSSIMYEIALPNIVSRYIKIQRPGVLTLCEVQVFQGVCEVGWFGQECKQICHCADNKPCDGETGYCQTIACKTGWQGKSCNIKCPPDTFGDNCNETCYCAIDTCTHDYGICPDICRRGYSGPHCSKVVSDKHKQTDVQMQNDSNSAAVIGGAIGASAAVILLVILVGVFVYKRRKNTSESNEIDNTTSNTYIRMGRI